MFVVCGVRGVWCSWCVVFVVCSVRGVWCSWCVVFVVCGETPPRLMNFYLKYILPSLMVCWYYRNLPQHEKAAKFFRHTEKIFLSDTRQSTKRIRRHYPTFYTLMSVGREKLFSISKECCRFSCCDCRCYTQTNILYLRIQINISQNCYIMIKRI